MKKNLSEINEYKQVTTRTFNYISVKIQNIVLNTSVDIQVIFYDANKNIGDIKMVKLTDTDYENWGNDDNYILNTACSKLGLTLTPASASAPESEPTSL